MKKNILIACGLAAMAALAQAAPVSVGQLTGGGANWTISATSANGFAVNDATFQATGQGDAFDDALTFRVNGAAYRSTGNQFDLNGQTATGGIATLSGLSVQTSYTALTGSPTLRTLFTLTNSGSQSITATVSMQTNVGSDGSTQIIDSSDGNTSFNLADRWLVTDDGAGGDPANLHVLWGLGGLLPTSVSSLVFNSAGTQGVRADFQVTLAAGQTSSLLMFNQIQSTAANAITGAADFSNLSSTDARLAGLTTAQRASIVNWNLGTTNTLPEPTSLLLVAVAGLAVGATRRRKAV